MKLKYFKLILFAIPFVLFGCGDEGSDDPESDMINAKILSWETEECYCCPGYNLEIGDETVFVDELPDNEEVNAAILSEEFPIAVMIKPISYEGDCPDRTITVSEIEIY